MTHCSRRCLKFFPRSRPHGINRPECLRSTKLPLPAATAEDGCGAVESGHDAAYWAGETKGFDFTGEDKLDSESFNIVLWKGLKGESQPYPSERDGRDLSKHREKILRGLRQNR
jgi:hypothetical protein